VLVFSLERLSLIFGESRRRRASESIFKSSYRRPRASAEAKEAPDITFEQLPASESEKKQFTFMKTSKQISALQLLANKFGDLCKNRCSHERAVGWADKTTLKRLKFTTPKWWLRLREANKTRKRVAMRKFYDLSSITHIRVRRIVGNLRSQFTPESAIKSSRSRDRNLLRARLGPKMFGK
jgi:hypothetical protein